MCVHTKYTYSIYGDGYKVPQHPHKHTQTHTVCMWKTVCETQTKDSRQINFIHFVPTSKHQLNWDLSAESEAGCGLKCVDEKDDGCHRFQSASMGERVLICVCVCVCSTTGCENTLVFHGLIVSVLGNV